MTRPDLPELDRATGSIADLVYAYAHTAEQVAAAADENDLGALPRLDEDRADAAISLAEALTYPDGRLNGLVVTAWDARTLVREYDADPGPITSEAGEWAIDQLRDVAKFILGPDPQDDGHAAYAVAREAYWAAQTEFRDRGLNRIRDLLPDAATAVFSLSGDLDNPRLQLDNIDLGPDATELVVDMTDDRLPDGLWENIDDVASDLEVANVYEANNLLIRGANGSEWIVAKDDR